MDEVVEASSIPGCGGGGGGSGGGDGSGASNFTTER